MTFHGARARLWLFFACAALCQISSVARVNPYLAKRGEPGVKVRIGACPITGGFIHLYTALDNHLFDEYGIYAEQVVVRDGE